MPYDREDTAEHDPDAKHDKRGEEQAVTHRDRIEYRPNEARRGRWVAGLIGLLGLWLVGSAVALDVSAAAFVNDVLVGAALVACGAYNYYRRSKRELGSASVATFAAVLGLWTVASPFVVGPTANLALSADAVGAWNDVLVGLLAFGLGIYSTFAIRARRVEADARPTATYDRTNQ